MIKFIVTILMGVAVSLPALSQEGGRVLGPEWRITRDLGCISPSEFSKEYTYPEYVNAYYACLDSGEIDKAGMLNFSLIFFSTFDAYRTDGTASDEAVMGLMREVKTQTGPELSEQINAILADINGGSSPLTTQVCDGFRALGVPDYFPEYLLEFAGENTENREGFPLKPGVDELKIWKMLLRIMPCNIDISGSQNW